MEINRSHTELQGLLKPSMPALEPSARDAQGQAGAHRRGSAWLRCWGRRRHQQLEDGHAAAADRLEAGRACLAGPASVPAQQAHHPGSHAQKKLGMLLDCLALSGMTGDSAPILLEITAVGGHDDAPCIAAAETAAERAAAGG